MNISIPYTFTHNGGLTIIDLGTVDTAIDIPFSASSDASFFVTDASNRVVDYGSNVLTDVINLQPSASERLWFTGHVSQTPWLGDYTGSGTFTATLGNASCVPEPGAWLLLLAGIAIVWLKSRSISRDASASAMA